MGGDHSLEYPNVAGVADVYGNENARVIHFDAPYDAGEGEVRHLISHARSIRRLIEEGHVLARTTSRWGCATTGRERTAFRYHTMAEIERDGWPEKRVLDKDGPTHLYISLDTDVLDPLCPRSRTPEPGSLTTRELFPLVGGLCTEKNLVSF